MSDLFLTILNMGIAASWVIGAVLVMRFFLCRAPKWLRCVLWAIVAVRLICPFSIESTFSLMPSAEVVYSGERQEAEPVAVVTGGSEGSHMPGTAPDGSAGDLSASASESQGSSRHTWIYVGSVVWVCGLAAMLGYALLGYLRIRRKVEEGVLLYGNVYFCDAVRSPFILGLIRPRIYLPSDMAGLQGISLGARQGAGGFGSTGPDTEKGCTCGYEYVLAHERAHLQRKDHWWKAFGYVLLAVYWFQPLVWVSYLLLCRDIELACDEKAVRNLDQEGRKAYARALVDCSRKGRTVLACPLAFGEVGVKERVRIVLNYRKPAFWFTVVAVADCVVVALCFLTNPKKDDSLADRIEAGKEDLTAQIGSMVGESSPGLPEANVPGSNTPESSASDYDITENRAREGINYYDLKGVSEDSLLLDEIEWIWASDSARAAEIGLDFAQHGAPYYIYNETELEVRCPFAEVCSFTLLDWQDNSFEPMQVDQQTFLAIMAERESEYSTRSPVPFLIEIADGKIVSVTEQYTQ